MQFTVYYSFFSFLSLFILLYGKIIKIFAETITQNNLALRQQLGLVARWSQQCESLQQQQRQKLLEFNQQITSLQRENDLLKVSTKVFQYCINILNLRN